MTQQFHSCYIIYSKYIAVYILKNPNINLKYMFIPKFIVALLIIAKIWKQPKHASTNE